MTPEQIFGLTAANKGNARRRGRSEWEEAVGSREGVYLEEFEGVWKRLVGKRNVTIKL
tara:strand:+ start:852 stop:1025 length:174 start_codon:yes stop_codon:yes gene_type:complete